MSSEGADEDSSSHSDGEEIKLSSSDEGNNKSSEGEETLDSLVVVEDDSEAYCQRVHEDTDDIAQAEDILVHETHASFRRLSRRLSHGVRRSSSFVEENLPTTPSGWAVLSSVLASCLLGYEIRLQNSLTCPPLVYAQHTDGPMKAIYDKLTQSEDSILRRTIQPSLFVGTRAMVSSTHAYALGGPPASNKHIRFSEVMDMTVDGGKVSIDWELPVMDDTRESNEERERKVRNGPIEKPVVIIIHGLNNHAKFGYIRSMMRACTDKGWIAAGMNLRGCGGLPLYTPRGYTGAYTGDIRCVVQTIQGRLNDGVPVFLVGNSLSASLVTKYLGEEGLSGTLPECVAGGAALGNPSTMKSTQLDAIFSPLLALGTKKTILQNWAYFRNMHDDFSRACIRRAMTSFTLAQFDEAVAPVMARNDPTYPFAYRIGYKGGLKEKYFAVACILTVLLTFDSFALSLVVRRRLLLERCQLVQASAIHSRPSSQTDCF